MQRTLFGILVLLVAAFSAIYFYPKGGKGGGEVEGQPTQKPLPKGKRGMMAPKEGMQVSEEPKKETGSKVANPKQNIQISSSGGIPIYSKVARPERFLKLPNGTFVAPLNGVKEPARFLWPKNLPFSPIIGKELDDHGRWWYVHQDGSRSTTFMALHPQTGKLDARTDIANPKKPLPIGGQGPLKK